MSTGARLRGAERLLLGLLALGSGARGQERPETDRPGAQADAEAEAALGRALAWLASPECHAPRDGSFLLGDAENPAPIAVTALATLAFLAHGEQEGRGKYGHVVAGGVRFLLNQQERAPGRVQDGYFRSDNDKLSRTHGHGFATLCLAQALGMVGGRSSPLLPDPAEVRTGLARAVRFIERIQGPSGGWYYSAYRDPDAHEGSVTITLVQALRAARGAGIAVDYEVIRRAETYVRQSQKADGSFRYMLGDERSSAALTAAAIATLNMAGVYDDPALERGLAYLREQINIQQSRMHHLGQEGLPFPYYERLYTAQAFWQGRSLRDWEAWFPVERRQILRSQAPNGSWKSRQYGSVYATAMNCLVLQMPWNYLPIFQR